MQSFLTESSKYNFHFIYFIFIFLIWLFLLLVSFTKFLVFAEFSKLNHIGLICLLYDTSRFFLKFLLISCYHFSMLSLFHVRVPVLFWGGFSDFFIILDFRIFLTLSPENRHLQGRTCSKIEKVKKYIFWTNICYQHVSSSSLKQKTLAKLSHFSFLTQSFSAWSLQLCNICRTIFA